MAVAQAKGKISWNVLDPDGVASATLVIDGTPVLNVGGPYAATSGVNFSAPIGALTSGDHTYTITVTDRLGHSTTAATSRFDLAASSPDDQPGCRGAEAKGKMSWNVLDLGRHRSSTLDRRNARAERRRALPPPRA